MQRTEHTTKFVYATFERENGNLKTVEKTLVVNEKDPAKAEKIARKTNKNFANILETLPLDRWTFVPDCVWEAIAVTIEENGVSIMDTKTATALCLQKLLEYAETIKAQTTEEETEEGEGA